MPFTPLHFGPSAALGWLFRKRVDWPALMLSNVAVDLEPLTVSLFRPGQPEHGFSHTFAGGAAVAMVFTALYIGLSRGLKKTVESGKVLFSSFLGVYSNMTIDALMYPEIRLLYPSQKQLLYGWLPENAVTWACGLMTAAWLVAWRAEREKV